LVERIKQLHNEKLMLEKTLASAKKTFDKMQAENTKRVPADNSELERLKLKYELLQEQNERLLDRIIAG
jgi:chromosome segregation ATPase